MKRIILINPTTGEVLVDKETNDLPISMEVDGAYRFTEINNVLGAFDTGNAHYSKETFEFKNESVLPESYRELLPAFKVELSKQFETESFGE